MADLSEHSLQLAVTQMLAVILPPSLPWTAVDHAAKLSARQAGDRKRRGVRRGQADYRFVLAGGRSGEIELKTKGTYQTPDQRAWQASVEAAGGYYAVCRSCEEVLTTLQGWGIECRARIAA